MKALDLEASGNRVRMHLDTEEKQLAELERLRRAFSCVLSSIHGPPVVEPTARRISPAPRAGPLDPCL
ncbi:MAG: hypothetical protein GY719_38190 [bacterium]|nr:hypothetical protein [bacterium]